LHLAFPSRYYIGISDNLDRVHIPGVDPNADASPLSFYPTGLIDDNVRMEGGNANLLNVLHLPNLANGDIDYGNLADAHGFGAHHNEAIYWHNLDALTTSALASYLTNET